MDEEVVYDEFVSVKNFKWITPSDEHCRKDMWLWFMFGAIPPSSIVTGIQLLLLLAHPTVGAPINMSLLIPSLILSAILFILDIPTHDSLLISIIYWSHHMPFRLIGAKAKFKLEFIPMIIAAAFHHLFEFNYLEFNYGYFCLILGITTYIYTIAHFMRIAYDIGGKDVLLGLIMLVLAFFLNGGLLVRGLGLSLCVALCLYRYVTYSAPELPEQFALLADVMKDQPIHDTNQRYYFYGSSHYLITWCYLCCQTYVFTMRLVIFCIIFICYDYICIDDLPHDLENKRAQVTYERRKQLAKRC